MPRRTRTTLLAGAAILALAPGAMAADVALTLADSDVNAEAIAPIGDALRGRGYEVIDRRGGDREEIAAALAEVAEGLADTDRLILVFAGAVRSAGARAWLLPADFDGEGRIDVALGGVPLDLLLDLAAEAPGRSAVVIADADADAPAVDPADGFLAVETGVGTPEPPQGVLLVAGPPEAAAQLVTEGLLGGSGGVAAALEQAPAEVAVFGFRSPEAAFVNPAPATVAPPAERAPVEPAAPPSTGVEAEAAETALALDQAARRGVQERLNVLGYATQGIDGIFGPGTRSAIAAWQQDQNLAGTGFLGGEQLRLLTALADARSAELAVAAEAARREEEAADAAFWRTTGAGGEAADLRAYLARYPDGVYAAEARATLDRLEAEALAAAAADDRAAWEAARAENRQRGYRGYLEAYPQGAFAGEAQARIDALREEPERARANEAAAAAEQTLGLSSGSRALIEGQLAAIGYDVGEPEGEFDGATRRALRAFQTRQGLEVTGYVNQETVQALIVASLGAR
jgi:peptidoglycan hydrolase-like protein with peptidoglycan-binding domain